MSRKHDLISHFRKMSSQDIIKLPINQKNELLMILKTQLSYPAIPNEKAYKTKLINKNRRYSYKSHVRKNMPKIIHQLNLQVKNVSSRNENCLPIWEGQIQFKSKFTQQSKRKSQSKDQVIKEFLAHFREISENHNKEQLSCSICLQILLRPVSTLCGHIFCYQCLDQSLIFSSNCPNCRESMKGTEVIVSPIVDAFLHKAIKHSKIFSTYRERQHKFQEWRKKREVEIESLYEGMVLDIRDTEYIWCQGQILSIINQGHKFSQTSVLVHFNRWNKIYNEIIEVPSSRLAPLHFFSSRTDIPRYSLSQEDDNLRGLVVHGGPLIDFQLQIQPNYIQAEIQSSESEEVQNLPQPQFQNRFLVNGLINRFISQGFHLPNSFHHFHIQFNHENNQQNIQQGESQFDEYNLNQQMSDRQENQEP